MSGRGTGSLVIGILGCGQAARMSARVLRRIPNLVLACASRDPARAQAFAAEVGACAIAASYETVLSLPPVNAVLVATPPATHFELAVAALRAGKHVVLEKPPVLDVTELARLGEAAQLAGRLVLVAENYFYKPLARRLRRLLVEGAVGDVLFVHINALKEQVADGWRADPTLAGGGALFEGGIHWIDLLANLGPAVERIEAIAAGNASPLERSVLVTLRYTSGAVATLAYSWEAWSPLRGLRISRVVGTRGSISFETNGLFVGVWGRRPRLLFPGWADIAGRKAMWRDFVRAIRQGREPEFDLARAIRDLTLLRRAQWSAGLEPSQRATP